MCLNFKPYSVETVGFHILKSFVMLLRGMMLNLENEASKKAHFFIERASSVL